ncbi:hypothetical protein PHAGE_BARTON_62 [Acinetobacter phage Barton]|nr:hypothetical protein PHAGE_BARTON_62 [Acinetobacter phage Barton]
MSSTVQQICRSPQGDKSKGAMSKDAENQTPPNPQIPIKSQYRYRATLYVSIPR